MSTVLLIVAFLTYSVWRETQWQIERKDLYNRIMSRDLVEYREEMRPAPVPPKAPRNKFVTAARKQNSPSKGGD